MEEKRFDFGKKYSILDYKLKDFKDKTNKALTASNKEAFYSVDLSITENPKFNTLTITFYNKFEEILYEISTDIPATDLENLDSDIILKAISEAEDEGEEYPSHTLTLEGSSWEWSDTEEFGYVQSSEEIQDSPEDLFFTPDGLKLFVLDRLFKQDGLPNERGIYQYDLQAPYDITELGECQSSYVISDYDNTIPYGLYFKPDGLVFYYVGSTSRKVFQVLLNEPWDLTSAYDRLESPQLATKTYQDIHISNDGTKAFITESSDDVVRIFTIGDAWDISTMESSNSEQIDIKSIEPDPYGLEFNPEGTKMFLVGKTSGVITEFALDAPWGSDTERTGYIIALPQANSTGIRFSNNGLRIFVIGTTTRKIDEFALDTPYSLQGAPAVSKERKEKFSLRTDVTAGLDDGKLILSYQKDENELEDILTIDKFGNIDKQASKTYVNNKIDNVLLTVVRPWELTAANIEYEPDVSIKDKIDNMIIENTDTGWQDIIMNDKLTGYIKYRKIDNRVFWRVALQLPADENDWGVATYIRGTPTSNLIDTFIRPIIALPFSLSTSASIGYGSSINHAAVTFVISTSGAIEIYANRSNEKGRYLSGEFSYFLD